MTKVILSIATVLACAASPVHAQDRSDDNAVTQAEDAFGFNVGRETIGIYGANSARGFSPTSAGNVRIDGLYFDPAFALPGTVVESSSVKVGLSAQGYPFTAPSGIVDYRLRRPQARSAASVVANFNSHSGRGVEIDGSLPVTGNLSLGYGLSVGRVAYPDGTDNFNHGQALIARWRPAPGVEIMPFWTLDNNYDDEAAPFFIPAGSFVPPRPPVNRFLGPEWVDFRYTGSNHGVIASASPGKDWLVRLGAFRSVFDQRTSFTNLLYDVQPDGTAKRQVVADPRTRNVALSGELRVTRALTEGPRLHVLHLNLRRRDSRREFGGSDSVDFGPTRIDEIEDSPKPAFTFGQLSRVHVEQTTLGLAYDGRWKGLGEISFAISRADYRKESDLPGAPVAISESRPWIYNGTAAVNLGAAVTVYAGYARGLEESGVAPPNATNRNQPLPAILTEQKDAGVRVNLTSSLKAVAGVFDLRRPYFGLDTAGSYHQVGTVRSRGVEFSLAGSLTPRLNLVAGGVVLDPLVERDATATGAIGRRPAGLARHLLNLNLNWRTPFTEGLSFDLVAVHRGAVATTTDNLVTLPPRPRVDLGGRYSFKLAGKSATLRLQVSNLFRTLSINAAGPGVYAAAPGRFVLGYLAVDL